jgi:transposase InsO family protein
MSQTMSYPVELACDVVDLPRSTYYYQTCKTSDEALLKAIHEIAGQYPTYGKRRMTHELRRPPYHYTVNHNHVERLMRQEGLLQPVRHGKVQTTNSQHFYPRYPNLVKGLKIIDPDQVWASDITYIRLGNGFVYLAIVMDAYTRAIRGWGLSKTLGIQLTLAALHHALENHCPQIHHSDQGIHYASTVYVALLQKHEIQISMAAIGRAEENGYAERVIRTIKEEEVYLSEYRDYAEAKSQIGRFVEDVYNRKRIHSSLGYLTPVEFEQAYWMRLTQSAMSTLSFPKDSV